MTGIEPALSTWELACHARPDQEPPGQRHGEAWEEVAAHGDSLGGTGEGSEIWTRNTQFLDQAVARAAATSCRLQPGGSGERRFALPARAGLSL
jgi:hypothetical protein